MSALDTIINSLRRERDHAKHHRDQAARAAQGGSPTREECEWIARAEAFSKALRIVREVQEQFASYR